MDHRKLIDYLEGKTSDIESWKIREWIQHPENEKECRALFSDIWNHAEIQAEDPSPDFEAVLNQLHHLINLHEIPRREESRIHKLYRNFSKVAAILILPLMLALGYYIIQNYRNLHQEPVALERIISTKPGSRMMVELPDGTKVWLNDGTTLKYPDRFAKDERRVFVDGEAYFEVTSNPGQPFIVENPMIDTRVSGTKFNINAYIEDNYFEATLLEGKIQAEKESINLEIEPGYQLRIDRTKNTSHYEKVNPDISKAWIDGKLIMQNEPLGIAAKKLSRWYNVEIILSSPGLNEYLLTATIEDEKPEQTFKLLAFALPIKYSIKTTIKGHEIKKTIYLTKK